MPIGDSLPYDYVAYIDESGDPGINRVKPLDPNGSSEWLVVSAVVIAAGNEPHVPEWISGMMADMRSPQLREIHFQRLSPARKLIATKHVAKLPVRCFVIVSNKQNMKAHRNRLAEKIPSNNWFYCWMTRLLLERVSHWVARHSLSTMGRIGRIKLVYSERGGLSYRQLNAYYEWLRHKGDHQFITVGNIVYETIRPALMQVINHAGHAGLKLPDIVASAFFKAADVHDTGCCDPTFAKALAPRMARMGRQIAGYGVKLMPGYGKLAPRVQPEQLEVFEFYGYPDQWWPTGAPKVV